MAGGCAVGESKPSVDGVPTEGCPDDREKQPRRKDRGEQEPPPATEPHGVNTTRWCRRHEPPPTRYRRTCLRRTCPSSPSRPSRPPRLSAFPALPTAPPSAADTPAPPPPHDLAAESPSPSRR